MDLLRGGRRGPRDRAGLLRPERPPSAGLSTAGQASSAAADDSTPYPPHMRPQAHYPQHRRSIVQHYAYPYPGYYHNDDTAGFRNPGGVGRHAEYYPAGDHFQVENDPVRTAKFAQGGGAPDRAEQLAAQRIGIQRNNCAPAAHRPLRPPDLRLRLRRRRLRRVLVIGFPCSVRPSGSLSNRGRARAVSRDQPRNPSQSPSQIVFFDIPSPLPFTLPAPWSIIQV